MHIKKIPFYVDNFRLNGTLHLPRNPGHKTAAPIVIGSHGLLSDGNSPKQLALAEKLNQRGIAYFRFDHRGRGQSEGCFPMVTTFQGRLNDMTAAIETALADPGIRKPAGLFGSSMGGAVCLGIAEAFDIKTIVTLAAPVRFSGIQVPSDIMEDPLFQDMKPSQMAFDISRRIRKIKNLLVFHGDADEVVSFSNAVEIFENAASPKRFVRFEGGDHAISRPDYQKQFINDAFEWLAAGLCDEKQHTTG